jgi:hypothetical protein
VAEAETEVAELRRSFPELWIVDGSSITSAN